VPTKKPKDPIFGNLLHDLQHGDQTHPSRGSSLPPLPRRPAAMPTGPKMFRVSKKGSWPLNGPGLPPAGFISRQHTGSEWVIYWASMRAFDPDRDPRKPPFRGGMHWGYQIQALDVIPGQHSKALSTNIDFFYQFSYPALAMRVQTYRYHLAEGSFKQAYDIAQAQRLLGSFDLIDIYEQDFLGDATGQAAIKLVKQVVGLIPTENPLYSSSTRMVRNPLGF
jgi:hypothetical protein